MTSAVRICCLESLRDDDESSCITRFALPEEESDRKFMAHVSETEETDANKICNRSARALVSPASRGPPAVGVCHLVLRSEKKGCGGREIKVERGGGCQRG